ncbi:hypothetical protein CEP52_013116 [Fusarium oligoseptatum]|uniref:Amino acid permease/ SLC12A domain-containing protein n=1 Tax=Fusarium oligoseptatum TaxID=2604345 RepID=A0A428SV05_9HYPO|nr:hypothetical protein CEP52_013116 [Fusarium oligoseptatum]
MADVSKTSPGHSEKTGDELRPIESHIHGEVIDNEAGMARLAGGKQTQRHLRPRHIQLMALSGAIGTGLFVGSGSALARAGPLGLLLGYMVYSLLVWSTFNAMGEMCVWLPIDGSFVVFAHAFMDDAWGFSLGWLYTVTNSLSAAGEVAAVAAIINFWTDAVNNVIIMVGGNPQGDAIGFRYWKNPGLFNEYIADGSWGHFLGFWSVFIQAAFAFGGPDYIAMSAGETRAPRRVLPSVFRRVIYRLAVFYILGVLAVGILVPYDDPNLGSNKPGAGASPFVIGITRLDIPVLPHIINGALLTSAWSCALELYFASTRAFVFTWITSIVGSANLLIYCIFHIIYIRFRRAQMAQGITDDQRPWFRRNQYYFSIVSLFFYLIIFFTNGFVVFTTGNWSISKFLFAYFPFVVFIVTYGGYKLIKRPAMVPLHEVPLHAGRTDAHMDDGFVEPEPVTWYQKFNRWLWG